MDRTEWPTDVRLTELREQGRVPLSLFASAAVGLAAALILVVAILPTAGAIVPRLWQGFSAGDQQGILKAAGELLRLGLVPVLGLLTGLLLAGLLQTRFLWQLSLAGATVHRLNPVANDWFRRHMALLGRTVLVMGLALPLLAALIWFFPPAILGLYNSEITAVATWLVTTVGLVVPLLAGALVVAAVLSWLLACWFFRWQNRMTRAEVAAEARGN